MISGKAFADKCKWVVDVRYPERRMFHHKEASSNDWVFLNGDYLYHLMYLLPSNDFSKKFTFVIHNTDKPFGQDELRQLLPYANHIYAINTTIRHPILTTIPLGFVDRQLPFLATFQVPSVDRDIEVYANFTVTTNPEKRNECLRSLPTNTVMRQNVSVPEYYADLCRSKFVLCPEGTGIDTHRVYESLLCGATPVVLRNTLSHLYEKLPVCIVDRWTDPFVKQDTTRFQYDVSLFLLCEHLN